MSSSRLPLTSLLDGPRAFQIAGTQHACGGITLAVTDEDLECFYYTVEVSMRQEYNLVGGVVLGGLWDCGA